VNSIVKEVISPYKEEHAFVKKNKETLLEAFGNS